MNAPENMSSLYERYTFERAAEGLTPEVFEHLVYLFPAILIAQADGHVDTSEVIHINKVARHFTNKDADVPEEVLKQEVRYLTWNTEIWRKPMLAALREMIAERGNGHQVVEVMISTASSSTGSLINNILLSTLNPGEDKQGVDLEQGAEFICEDEKKEIENIAYELGLLRDPSILEKLQQIINTKI